MIASERLVLRIPEPGDAPEILRYYRENREHLESWSPAWPPGHFTLAFWRDQIAGYRAERRAGESARMFVSTRDEPRRVIGTVSLTGIMRGPLQACYLGYSLASEAQGRGYMAEAVETAVRFAFSELRLHRVMANYMPHNQRSGAVLRRTGFTIEGYARDYLFVNGRWEDHILTSRVDPGWSPG